MILAATMLATPAMAAPRMVMNCTEMAKPLSVSWDGDDLWIGGADLVHYRVTGSSEDTNTVYVSAKRADGLKRVGIATDVYVEFDTSRDGRPERSSISAERMDETGVMIVARCLMDWGATKLTNDDPSPAKHPLSSLSDPR
jgi:hypothetical protein